MSNTAVAYFRTSSATNVGSDKDSLKRQQEAVTSYAAANGVEVVREFYDAAVSGADAIQDREGFSDLLTYVAGNGARTILVENASRFARDLAVQLTGHEMLKQLGYELVPVDAPKHFTDDTPTATMVRQILGAVSEFEKAQVVSKLKAARTRKRVETGKCEGRKSHKELDPALAREAKQLRLLGYSLAKVSELLFEQGHKTSSGKAFAPAQISRLIA